MPPHSRKAWEQLMINANGMKAIMENHAAGINFS
jgi:hypothetical protein